MGEVELLLAVEAALKTAFADPDGKRVGVQPDGQPPPVAGPAAAGAGWYVGIDDDGSTNQSDQADQLDNRFGVRVVLSWWASVIPQDRRGRRLLAEGELRERAATVQAALHASYAVLLDANARLATSQPTRPGFVEPLLVRSASRVQPRGADWLWAEPGDDAPTVLVKELVFAGARRIEPWPPG
jgi:hypothetical protein